MANNYTQFSETVDDLTPEEIEWWEKELQPYDELEEDEQKAWLEEGRGVDDPDHWPSFSWEVQNDYLWIYADEYGNVDNVGIAVQRFLERFRPNGYFTLSWATWCSRPRIGEFQGGALFVTHEGVEWMTTWNWLNKKERERKP